MKSVRFKENNSLVTLISEIKNRIDISQQEFEGTWYSRNEFKNFRKDCITEAKVLYQSGQWHILDESFELLNDNSIPSENVEMDDSQFLLILWSMTDFRGLEAWGNSTRNAKKHLLRRRKLSMEVVLEAQRLLRNDTSADEKLRLISKSVTLQSRKFARKMGIADAIISNTLGLQDLTSSRGYSIHQVDAFVHSLQAYDLVKLLGISNRLNQSLIQTSVSLKRM
jgi:hypothetical protein